RTATRSGGSMLTPSIGESTSCPPARAWIKSPDPIGAAVTSRTPQDPRPLGGRPRALESHRVRVLAACALVLGTALAVPSIATALTVDNLRHWTEPAHN